VFDSVLSVTLADALDGTTLLTLVHEQLDALPGAMPRASLEAGAGWEKALDRLTTVLLST
jgi:hypothetical protein